MRRLWIYIFLALLFPLYFLYYFWTEKLPEPKNLLQAVPSDAQAILQVNHFYEITEWEAYPFLIPAQDSSSLLTWNLDLKDLEQTVSFFPILEEWAEKSQMLFIEKANGNRIFVSHGSEAMIAQFRYMVEENSMYLQELTYLSGAYFWSKNGWMIFASTPEDIEDVVSVLQKKSSSILDDSDFVQAQKTTLTTYPAQLFFNKKAWKKTFWGKHSGLVPEWLALDLQPEAKGGFVLKGFFNSKKNHSFISQKNVEELEDFVKPAFFSPTFSILTLLNYQNPDHFLYTYLAPYFLYSKGNRERFLFFKIKHDLTGLPPIKVQELQTYLSANIWKKLSIKQKNWFIYQDQDWLVLSTKPWIKKLETQPFFNNIDSMNLEKTKTDFGFAIDLSTAQNPFIPPKVLASMRTQILVQDSLSYWIQMYFYFTPKPVEKDTVFIKIFPEKEFIFSEQKNSLILQQTASRALILKDKNEKKLWEFILDQEIYGQVHLVFSKELKKELLVFVAGNKLYILDKNTGKPEPKFPILLTDQAFLGVQVKEFKNQLYFWIPIAQRIHTYQLQGKDLTWKNPVFKSEIAHLPFHFSLSNKNYIFVLDKKGTVFLLDMQGKLTHKWNNKLQNPEDLEALHLELGKTLAETNLHLDYKNGIKQTVQLK